MSSAPACGAHDGETNTPRRSTHLLPTLRSLQTPHDYRRHHSSEESPVSRAAACSALKNNRASATLRRRQTASRFPRPRTGAFPLAQASSVFLKRAAQLHRLPWHSATLTLVIRTAAPPSPGHAMNSACNPSSQSQPITRLRPPEFLQFFSWLLLLPK